MLVLPVAMKAWLFLAAVVVVLAVVRRNRSRRRRLVPSGVVVITGASSGIGRELALIAAKRKSRVVLVARRRDALDAVAKECRDAGAADATCVPCDITSADDRQRLFEHVRSLGRLSVLILNAGRGAICDFSSADESSTIARQMMEVNYFANVELTRGFFDDIRRCHTRILVISSLSGVLSTPQRSQYCASKFALMGFFNALRMELEKPGPSPTITVACPGFVATPFHSSVMNAAGDAPARKGKFMTAAECARQAWEAMEDARNELIMTTSGWLGYHLRPFLPRIVDFFAIRKAQSSIK